MKNFAKLGLLATLVLTACNNGDDNIDDHDHDHDHDHHVTYVINEGGFMNNNASISSVDDDGNVEQNLFFTANGEVLGDVAQDMVITNDYGYIVVNNSQKVEVVHLDDFASEATISGLSYPRHAIVDNGRIFVTNGSFGGMVYEIDPATNTLIDSVEVGSGPERMAVNGSDLIVVNSGGWASDSTVSIVDLTTLSETQKVEVGPQPLCVEVDADGNIWVLSKGTTIYDDNWSAIGGEGSKLVQLSGTDFSVLKTIELGDYTSQVSKMTISADGQTIYYAQSGVFKLSITATQTEATAFIAEENVTGLAVNEDGQIVILNGGYDANGTMKVYSTSGNLVSSNETGIAPNGIAFE